ncbi:TetR/AcrR family transcriptional regulator [Pseudonocardia zijingensis]|uniref:TetR/AcrR family transcriptional regulator n=2 Tax=Pseudonocardia zijingensis TaxID=153376 RepID=UPI00360E093D
MAITRRPGGRTARTRAAVLAAVEAELLDHGFDGLSVDAVAERSGVHRATVYRRWRDVGGLLADALAAGREDDWTPPDRGSLAADLTALNQDVVRHLTAERSLARALIVASHRSPAAAHALHEFLDDRYRRSEVVVDRAVSRGEVPAGTDARRLLVAATAPLYHELLLLGGAVDDALAARWAADAARAAAAGVWADERVTGGPAAR